MEVNVNTYLSAKWRVEVCQSGDSGITSYYPFGEEMRSNMILDSWLESFAFFPTIGQPVLMSQMTDGYMQLGNGTGALDYKGIALSGFVRETNYIRPNTTGGHYTDVTGSGMRTYSRTFEFPSESGSVTYYEAGFRPDLSSLWDNSFGNFSLNVPTNKKNPIFSRFLFPTGSDGLVSGIALDIGQYMKVKYDVSIRVPALVDPIMVTGSDVVYGDFNGSGQIKLVGSYGDFFGNLHPDGEGYYSNLNAPLTGVNNATYPKGIIWPLSYGFSFNYSDFAMGSSANYVPTGVNFPTGYGVGVSRIDIQQNNKWPRFADKTASFNGSGTASSAYPSPYTYPSGYSWGDKHIDITLLFPANYPNYDMSFGGILFSPWTASYGHTYAPDTGFGWYYKFDNPQMKYLDQMLQLTYRFSAQREA
jgi:hypothetical protein